MPGFALANGETAFDAHPAPARVAAASMFRRAGGAPHAGPVLRTLLNICPKRLSWNPTQ